MGCGSSTPAVKDHHGTSAASHHKARSKPADQQSLIDIGPGYKAVKHLGARGERVIASGGWGVAGKPPPHLRWPPPPAPQNCPPRVLPLML